MKRINVPVVNKVLLTFLPIIFNDNGNKIMINKAIKAYILTAKEVVIRPAIRIKRTISFDTVFVFFD